MEHIGGRLQVSAHAPDFVRQKKRQKSWPGHYLHTYSKRASDTKRMWIFLARTDGMQMAGKKHTGEFPVYTHFFSTRMCRVLKYLCNLESRASNIGSLILSVEELALVQVILCDIDLNLYCLCYIYICMFIWIYADCSTYKLTEQFMYANLCQKMDNPGPGYRKIRQSISRHICLVK